MCEREHRPSIRAIRRYLKEQYKFPDEQIDTMLPSFLATLVGHMDFLGKAMAEKSSAEVGKAAHTIKGAFLNLGLHDCADLAKQIEEKGKEGQSKDALAPLVAQLQAKITPLLAE
ncbi:MAG: Hpt domain-containing protein [Desulforhopalus sp.]